MTKNRVIATGRALLLASALTGASGAWAQADWRTSAVPFYTAGQYAQAVAHDGLARAQAWQGAADRLLRDLQQHCGATASAAPLAATVLSDWRDAARAWDGLDSVETGPLVRRRSARTVDFMPARPAMLERAIQAAPDDGPAMERIGAPAKGFEALESLLWPDAPRPASPRCAYAVAVAAHLQREAVAVVAGFGADAAVELEPEPAQAAFSEAINQWVGGIEQLRWAYMRKPVEVGRTRGEPAAFPRARSGQSADSWAARWRTLRAFAVLDERPTPPRVGAGQLIPFETWLRSRGANGLADKLVLATREADAAMAAARSTAPETVLAGAAALARLTRLAQEELAPALNVSLGFSDADGD